jgi:hypothetical protein
MKLLNIRRVLLIVVTGSAFAGVISSNVGCGDSNNATAGSGGSSGGGSGGTTGNGGGGGQKPVKLSYTFDTATSSDSTMWKLNDYMDPASPPKNLGWYSKGDAAIASLPTFEWASDDSESSASSGSMKITVTFTDYGQYVDPVINISPTVDLSNSTLALKVRLLSGNFSNGGVQFHFSTTQKYTYGAGQWMDATTFTNNSWKITSIDTATASPATAGADWDPAQVIQVGVQVTSGTMTATSTLPTGPLVFEIDTVQAR